MDVFRGAVLSWWLLTRFHYLPFCWRCCHRASLFGQFFATLVLTKRQKVHWAQIRSECERDRLRVNFDCVCLFVWLFFLFAFRFVSLKWPAFFQVVNRFSVRLRRLLYIYFFSWFSDYTLDFASLIIDWMDRWMRGAHKHTYVACVQCWQITKPEEILWWALKLDRSFDRKNSKCSKNKRRTRKKNWFSNRTHIKCKWCIPFGLFVVIVVVAVIVVLCWRLCEWTGDGKEFTCQASDDG